MRALACCKWLVTPSEPQSNPTKLTTKASGLARCSAEMFAASLSPIDRELRQRRVQDPLLGLIVVGQHDPGDRDKEKQQREHGEESVEGDERGRDPPRSSPYFLATATGTAVTLPTSLEGVEAAEEPAPGAQLAGAAGLKVHSMCLIPLMNGESRRSGSLDA